MSCIVEDKPIFFEGTAQPTYLLLFLIYLILFILKVM